MSYRRGDRVWSIKHHCAGEVYSSVTQIHLGLTTYRVTLDDGRDIAAVSGDLAPARNVASLECPFQRTGAVVGDGPGDAA